MTCVKNNQSSSNVIDYRQPHELEAKIGSWIVQPSLYGENEKDFLINSINFFALDQLDELIKNTNCFLANHLFEIRQKHEYTLFFAKISPSLIFKSMGKGCIGGLATVGALAIGEPTVNDVREMISSAATSGLAIGALSYWREKRSLLNELDKSSLQATREINLVAKVIIAEIDYHRLKLELKSSLNTAKPQISTLNKNQSDANHRIQSLTTEIIEANMKVDTIADELMFAKEKIKNLNKKEALMAKMLVEFEDREISAVSKCLVERSIARALWQDQRAKTDALAGDLADKSN